VGTEQACCCEGGDLCSCRAVLTITGLEGYGLNDPLVLAIGERVYVEGSSLPFPGATGQDRCWDSSFVADYEISNDAETYWISVFGGWDFAARADASDPLETRNGGIAVRVFSGNLYTGEGEEEIVSCSWEIADQNVLPMPFQVAVGSPVGQSGLSCGDLAISVELVEIPCNPLP
jgi:hypothetical protein